MTRYPDPPNDDDDFTGGPSGAPSRVPPSPRWPLVAVVIVALALVAAALFAHAG